MLCSKFKHTCILIIAIFIALSLYACAGVGDWTCDLPGRYELWRINGRNVALCLPDERYPEIASKIVDAYVFELAYDDDFICVKRADVPEENDVKIDTANPDYYIVDVHEEKCYGPFSGQAFHESCQELGVDGNLKWLDLWTLRHADTD